MFDYICENSGEAELQISNMRKSPQMSLPKKHRQVRKTTAKLKQKVLATKPVWLNSI